MIEIEILENFVGEENKMNYENKTWNDLAWYLKDKNIVLFGNAKSVLQSKKEIDATYNVICRINLGFPEGKEEYIGSETDILFMSMPIDEEQLIKLNPHFLIWCTPRYNSITDYLNQHALKYPIEHWQVLYDEIGARPSTGLMAIDILRKSDFKSITLYGFDSWTSETWYTNKKAPCHHLPSAEKLFIEKVIYDTQKKIIKL